MALGLQSFAFTVPGVGTGVAHSSGDQVGTIISIAGAANAAGGGGEVRGALLWDETSATSLALELWLFEATVTLAADNVAFTIASLSDMELMCAGPKDLPFGAITVAKTATAAVQTAPGGVAYRCAATTLFVAVRALSTRGAGFTNAVDLKGKLLLNVLG